MAELQFFGPHTILGGAEVLGREFQEDTENSRAWKQLNLRQAKNAETVDHLADIMALVQMQIGIVEGQQTTSPGRTGTPEATIDTIGVESAGVGASAQAIATSLGNLASALVPIITASGGVITAQTLAALLPVVITAVGGASTPSQTKPATPPTP